MLDDTVKIQVTGGARWRQLVEYSYAHAPRQGPLCRQVIAAPSGAPDTPMMPSYRANQPGAPVYPPLPRGAGTQLVEALENGVSQWPKLEGRFPQVSGVRFAFDPSQPPGQRIVPGSVTVGGADLQPGESTTGVGPHMPAGHKLCCACMMGAHPPPGRTVRQTRPLNLMY